MALKTFKPYTKSTRGTVVIDKSVLWKGTPYKPLTKGQNFTGGRNNNGRMDIQSTYFPMRMISKIFESNIVKINKDQTEEVYTYSCYDKNNKEVLRYILDWQSHDFTCVSTFSQDTIVHKSLNLFDKADNLGKF